MAFSQSDLDTLDAAIATGAQRVRFADGRELQYRSLDEMIRARTRIAESVAGTPDNVSRVTLVTL